jgi:Coenzyme PQQ synthesis protein D (PqqD)
MTSPADRHFCRCPGVHGKCSAGRRGPAGTIIRRMPPGVAPLRHDDSVVAEQVDDDLCLYRPQSSDVAVLNRTAAEIWRLADGRAERGQITIELAARYDLDADEVAIEVDRVLTDLATRGFLVTG